MGESVFVLVTEAIPARVMAVGIVARIGDIHRPSELGLPAPLAAVLLGFVEQGFPPRPGWTGGLMALDQQPDPADYQTQDPSPEADQHPLEDCSHSFRPSDCKCFCHSVSKRSFG